ncbi:MAG: hypothetical protein LUD72_03030 [Bacteroidales bacterium]|nr:hypothetical protein [Bacteroidales bacterium]
MTAEKVYVTADDVKALLGVKDSKAYEIIRDINTYATKNGQMAFPNGKANKYMFAERFGIPQEVVNAAINS